MNTSQVVIPSRANQGVERRRASRVALCIEVGFQSDSNFYAGFTEDISEGGLFVATHMLKEIGTELVLRFTLPDAHEISVVGVVRWLRDPYDADSDTTPGMGVQLRDLSADDLTMIREFLMLRDPLFHDVD
jgi:uncharacterized protein (TIGR02266 family)